jgi:type 1 glutamine amidotransferase
MSWRSRGIVLGLFVVFLSSLAFVVTEQAYMAQEKIQVLLVTGHDVRAHDWRKTTARVRSILEESGRFEVRVSEDTGIFEASTLERYDVIVNNFGHWSAPDLSPEAREGLLDFVRGGKGLVSLHFACASYQDWEEYTNLIGRIWKKGVGGHGPRGKFTVKFVDKEHPITAGLTDFEMDDELYAKLTGDAEIRVLATAKSDWSGNVEPMIFVKSYGKGRVVQNVLGHDVKAQDNETYAALIRRGAEWAATGKVTVK